MEGKGNQQLLPGRFSPFSPSEKRVLGVLLCWKNTEAFSVLPNREKKLETSLLQIKIFQLWHAKP